MRQADDKHGSLRDNKDATLTDSIPL